KYTKHLAVLSDANLLQRARLIPPIASPMPLAYRTHAKLAIRPASAIAKEQRESSPNSEQRFSIGLFQPGSHRIVDLGYCPLHRNTINRVVQDLRKILERSSLTPYEESTH